jgi:hypothetical protein
MIELTEQQWQGLTTDAIVVDPRTQEEYGSSVELISHHQLLPC